MNRLVVLLAAVLCTLAGGATTDARGQGSAQPVQWVNLVNTTANGGTLQKTGGQWDAGANSQQQITAAGGYVEFSATNHRMQVGLSNDASAAVDYTQLKYTFNLWGTEFDIREGWGNMRLWGGAFTPGDVFRIAVESGVVKYYKNGTLLYTSGVVPSYPLVLDTALSAMDATVQDAVISSSALQNVQWVNLVDANANGGTLQKTAGAWDSGANSRQTINATGQYVEFSATNHRMQVGLSNDTSAAVDYSKLKYTFNIWGSEFDIREGWENQRVWGGAFTPGDVFRIAVESGVVKYYKNGTLLYTSGVAPSYPLVLDTALSAMGATVQNAVIFTTDWYAPPPPVARVSADRAVKPGTLVTLDGSASTSTAGNPTYSWQQVAGAPVTLSNADTVSPSFTTLTPAGDRDCYVIRLTVTDAGGSSSNDVYVGVVKTGANDEVVISDSKVRLLVGPQLMHGSPFVPHPKFDEIEFNRGRAHGEMFPNIAPHVIGGNVSATNGSRTVTGAGTHFTQEIEMDPLVSTDYRGRLRIRDADGSTMRSVEVESIQSDTQLTLKTAWAHTNTSNAPADTYHGENSGALITWWNYYDTAYTMYIEYYRTGNTRYLGFARKAADVWWSSDFVGYGTVMGGPNGLGPRNMAMAGLILRALDGKPEYWDFINRKVRNEFDHWVLRHLSRPEWLANPQLFYDIREDGYAQLYAVMLSQVLPDTYPLYPNGTHNAQVGTENNGLTKRQQYVADVNNTAVNFFGRLQYPDGSWRWDIARPDGTIELVATMQPFMLGIYLEAAILHHQVAADPGVKANLRDQIVKACRHLRDVWRNSVVPDLPNNVRWRGQWYFYHGGTPANDQLFANGGGYFDHDSNPNTPDVPTAGYPSTTGGDPGVVTGQRHLNSEVQHAIGYAYVLTGDPTLKAHGDDMLEADFGGADGIYAQADTPGKPKDYNMNYRGAGRYLVWRLAPPNRAVALDGVDDRGVVNLPNAAPFNAVGDFEIAFRMRDARVNHTAYQDVFTNGVLTVRVGANTDWIGAVDWSTGGQGPFINISTRTYFRIRHTRATGVMTIEGWDADGSNYAIASVGGGTTGTINFAGDLGFGRAPWSGGHHGPLQAKVDWLRWRSSVGPAGVRPLDGDTDYDLLRWEFDGDGQDSSPGGMHLTLDGSPVFENSP
jgi:hypothetical protein